VVLGVGNQDAPIAILAKMFRPIQSGGQSRPIVAGVARAPGSAHDGFDGTVPFHHPQRVAAAFQNINAPLPVRDHRPWIDQRRRNGLRSIWRHAFRPVPRYQTNLAAFHIHRSNPAIIQIGQEQFLASRAEGDAIDAPKAGLDGGAAIARIAFIPGAGPRADQARARIESADSIAPGVRKINRTG
jgi:hypothetical protein